MLSNPPQANIAAKLCRAAREVREEGAATGAGADTVCGGTARNGFGEAVRTDAA